MTSAPRALAEAAALELAATTPGLQLLVLHGGGTVCGSRDPVVTCPPDIRTSNSTFTRQ